MIQTKKKKIKFKKNKKKIAEIVQVFEGIQNLMLKTIRIFQFRSFTWKNFTILV